MKPKLKGVTMKAAALVSVATIALAGAGIASAKPNPPGCRNPVPQLHNPNCAGATTAAGGMTVRATNGGGTVGKSAVRASGAGGTVSAGHQSSAGNTGSMAASGSSGSDVVSADYSGGAAHAYLCTKAGAMYVASVADVREDLARGSRYASQVLGHGGSQPNATGTGYFTCRPPAGTRIPAVLADNNGWLYPSAMADFATIGYAVYR